MNRAEFNAERAASATEFMKALNELTHSRYYWTGPNRVRGRIDCTTWMLIVGSRLFARHYRATLEDHIS